MNKNNRSLAAVFGVALSAMSLGMVENAVGNEILEAEIIDLNERIDSAMKFSGYVDIEHRSYRSQNKASEFRINVLSLFMMKKISNKVKFFAEIEYEGGPEIENHEGDIEIEGGIFMEALNIDFTLSPSAAIRVGRFYTPAGYWNENHYSPYNVTQSTPQMFKKIFPLTTDGAMVHGKIRLSDSFINYNLYTGNGRGNSGESDSNDNKAVGIKIAAMLPALSSFEIGASAYRDILNDNNAGNPEKNTAMGIHAKIKAGGFDFQSEYARGTVKDEVAVTTVKSRGYYAQFAYSVNSWTYGLRYDYYNADTEASVVVSTKQNIGFANYHVTDKVVLKAEYILERPTNEATVIFSTAVYLGD